MLFIMNGGYMLRLIGLGVLVVASSQALAAGEEIVVSGKLAGSARYLDSDYEGGDEFKPVNNASRISLAAQTTTGDFRWFGVVEAGEKNQKAGIDALRQLYAGVDTPVGEFVVGRKASDYRLSGETLDPFYDTAIAGFNGREAREGASYGLSNLTNGYSHTTLAYATPALFGALRLNAAAYLSSEDEPNDQVDYAAGAEYSMPGFGADQRIDLGVQYLKIENPAAFAAGNPARNGLITVGGSPGESDSYRVYASYAAARFTLNASYESVDVATEPEARAYSYVSGTYALCEKTELAASYGWLDFENGSPALSGTGVSLGVFRELLPNLKGYVAARQISLDAAGDATTAAIGLAYSFSVAAHPQR